MGIQYMTPGSTPLVIETPMGLIEIRWDQGRRRKRLMITMPAGTCVHRGLARAMSKLRFLVRREDGTLGARYSVLSPDLDERGQIRGVREPDRFALRVAQ